MKTYDCLQCNERFRSYGPERPYCGKCRPVDADHPANWSAAAAANTRRRLLQARAAELAEAEATGQYIDQTDRGESA